MPSLRESLPRRTARLTLRALSPDDAASVFAYRSLPSVAEFMTAMPGDLEAFRAGFAEFQENNLAIELDGAVIGDAMVKRQNAWSQAEVTEQAVGAQAELGWCLAPGNEGRGFATEVAEELLSIAFEGLGVRRIEAGCFAENAASRRVMEKVGLRLEGVFLKESLHRDGTWRDGASYALLAEEWFGRRGDTPAR
ncbi:MAG: GNAT family protein [bacterium]|nr:GNAT family protein [bacterium]